MNRGAWLVLLVSSLAGANGPRSRVFLETRVVAPWVVGADPAPAMARLAEWRGALDDAAREASVDDAAALEAENARYALTLKWVEVQAAFHAAWRELDAATLAEAQALFHGFWVEVERFDATYPTRPSLLDASRHARDSAATGLRRLATFRPVIVKRLAGIDDAEALAKELEAALDDPRRDAASLVRGVAELRALCAELAAPPWPVAARLLDSSKSLPVELASRLEVPVACLNASPTKVEGAARWYSPEVRARREQAGP